MSRSAEEWRDLAACGAGFEVDGRQFTAQQLGFMVANATKGNIITITNVSNISTDELKKVALRGRGSVVFKE